VAYYEDLNENLYSHEKSGGNPRPTSYMQAFRDVLSDCSLEDLGFVGDPYTWKRGRIVKDSIGRWLLLLGRPCSPCSLMQLFVILTIAVQIIEPFCLIQTLLICQRNRTVG
jgi:hypothetical protein